MNKLHHNRLTVMHFKCKSCKHPYVTTTTAMTIRVMPFIYSNILQSNAKSSSDQHKSKLELKLHLLQISLHSMTNRSFKIQRMLWHIGFSVGPDGFVNEGYIVALVLFSYSNNLHNNVTLNARSHEKILAKYVQNVTLINNTLIQWKENIAL